MEKIIQLNDDIYVSLQEVAQSLSLDPEELRQKLLEKANCANNRKPAYNAKPVTINGIRYATITEAAKALQISRHALTNRLKKGETDGILTTKKPCPVNSKPITIGGVTYDSLAAAARAIGLARSTLRSRIKNGYNDEEIITGRPLKKEKKPVTICGYTYASMKNAARACGVSRKILSQQIIAGYQDEDLINALHSDPIVIGGITYTSVSAAARTIGIPALTLCRRLEKGYNEEELVYGKKPHYGKGGRSITICGITYPSLSCAAKTLGVSMSRLSVRINAGYKDEELIKSLNTPKEGIRVEIDGVTYVSIAEAARDLGISEYSVVKKICLQSSEKLPEISDADYSNALERIEQLSLNQNSSKEEIENELSQIVSPESLAIFHQKYSATNIYLFDRKIYTSLRRIEISLNIPCQIISKYIRQKYNLSSNAQFSSFRRFCVIPASIGKKKSKSKSGVSVTIQGKTYPTIAAAAQALGINKSVLAKRLRKGLRDEELLYKRDTQPLNIEIDGEIFHSYEAIAQKYKICRNTIYTRYMRGLTGHDLIAQPKQSHTKQSNSKPIKINGIEYASMAEASRMLGIAYPTLVSRINKKMTSHELTRNPKQSLGRRIKYNGKQYYSVSELCKDYNIDIYRLRSIMRTHELSYTEGMDYVLEKDKNKQVVYNGTTYPSFAALCKAYNQPDGRVWARLSKGWSLEAALTTSSEQAAKMRRSIPVEFRGEKFSSQKECFEKYQVVPSYVRDYMKSGLSFEEAMNRALNRKRGWGTE